MHHFKKTVLFSLLSVGTLLSPLAPANPNNTAKTTTYGDNPNIIRVLAGKTQEAVQNTAEKIGAATERGIAKIKPTVDNTWNGTKDYTTEQAIIARDNTRQGIDITVKKVQETKNKIVGNGAVPIERGDLSQNTPQASSTQSNVTSYSSAQNTQQIQRQSIQTQALAPQFEPAPIPQSPSNPVSPSLNNEVEPEIKRQSIPIQNTSTNVPANAAPTNIVEAPKNTSQSNAVQDDVEAGIPR